MFICLPRLGNTVEEFFLAKVSMFFFGDFVALLAHFGVQSWFLFSFPFYCFFSGKTNL
uniref:Uncharacterized protein n=1 Tax=Anguilla anguilla TaxID=7936 RepID=A0A0E9P858_ANGAN